MVAGCGGNETVVEKRVYLGGWDDYGNTTGPPRRGSATPDLASINGGWFSRTEKTGRSKLTPPIIRTTTIYGMLEGIFILFIVGLL